MKTIDRDALSQASLTLKYLANPKILMILCRLGEEEVSAGALAEFVEMEASALSQHLRRLKTDGVVTARREHRHLYYRLTDERVRTIITTLQTLYCPDPISRPS